MLGVLLIDLSSLVGMLTSSSVIHNLCSWLANGRCEEEVDTHLTIYFGGDVKANDVQDDCH